MFCHATGLPQSEANRASDSLAEGWQNKVQIVQTGHQPVTSQKEIQKEYNRGSELRRKRLRRNNARKNKMRQMTKKEKRALVKSKLVKEP